MIEYHSLLVFLNFILCLIIFLLGILISKKNKAALYIGLGFGLFAVSHLIPFLGVEYAMKSILISVRMLAYLVVILGLFKSTK